MIRVVANPDVDETDPARYIDVETDEGLVSLRSGLDVAHLTPTQARELASALKFHAQEAEARCP